MEDIKQAINLCVKPQNQQEIEKGQQFLESQSLQPQYIVKLLVIAEDTQLDINIRQFSLANLKNNIKKYWKPKKDEEPRFTEEDKNTVRNNILEALIRSSTIDKLCKLYTKIIYDICAYDYPQNWSDFVDSAIQKLTTSQDEKEIYGCLQCLLQIFSHLQFELNERKPLDDLILKTFPAYQLLLQKLIPVYNQDNAYLLKPILKSFFMTINLQLSIHLQKPEALDEWLKFFKMLIDSIMPSELTSPTTNQEIMDQRNKHPLWKNKKWAGRIINRFIIRYSNLKVIEKELIPLAEWLIEAHMPKYLESFLNQLVLSQKQFIGNATIHFSLKFLVKSIRFSKLFTILVPYIETILYDCLIPLLSFTPREHDLWQNDPHEYIRQEDEFISSDELNSHKIIATELILNLVKNEFSKTQYLLQLLPYCVSYLEKGVNPRNESQQLSLATKDGIFFLIGQLKDIIIRENSVKDSLELLLQKYVFVEFQNQNDIIKARACYLLGKYGNIDFQNPQNIIQSVQGITSCMANANLPVRFKAALALNTIIQQKQAKELIKNHLQDVLKIYLKLMDEIDSEELVSALEGLVEQFEDQIAPFAYDLCLHLTSAFFKYIQKLSDTEKDEGESEMAASQCIYAIGKIYSSPISQQVVQSLESLVLPVINTCLTKENCFIDEILHLLQQIVYKSQKISVDQFFYFPILTYILCGKENVDLSNIKGLNEEQMKLLESAVIGWGLEYVNEIVIILKNYIQKGDELFWNAKDMFGVSFLELIFLIVKKMYFIGTNGKNDEDEGGMISSIQLFYTLIENNLTSGKINGVLLQQIITQTLSNLNSSKIKQDVAVANLDTLSLCLYFNFQETLNILYNQLGVQDFLKLFNRWFSLLQFFKNDYNKQRILLGFSTLISYPNLPKELVDLVPRILKECVNITTQIIQLREDEEFEEDNSQDGGNSTGDFADIGQQKQKYENQDYDDDFDENFDPFSKYKYNYCYNCPLENVDEILFLEQELIKVQSNRAYYTHLTNLLQDQDKLKLQENINQARKDYQEYLQNNQK